MAQIRPMVMLRLLQRRARPVLRSLPARSQGRHSGGRDVQHRGPPRDRTAQRYRPRHHRRAGPRGGTRAVWSPRVQLDATGPACRLGHGELLHHVRARLSRAAGDRRPHAVHQPARPVPGGARGHPGHGPDQGRMPMQPARPGRQSGLQPEPVKALGPSPGGRGRGARAALPQCRAAALQHRRASACSPASI